MKDIKLYHDDAIVRMKKLIAKGIQVDAIIADPPFGTTNCKWDTIITLDEMWDCIWTLVKPNGAVFLFAQTPFDKVLGASNIKDLRYEWIYEKAQATGHLNAKKMPMKAHENILVFYKKLPTYNPIKTLGHSLKTSSSASRLITQLRMDSKEDSLYNKVTTAGKTPPNYSSTERYPRSVLKFSSDKQKLNLHPTQKPLALVEYLTKTYTNEGDLVLNFCMGSGTGGVVCKKLNRKFIGIEITDKYFKISKDRINETI